MVRKLEMTDQRLSYQARIRTSVPVSLDVLEHAQIRLEFVVQADDDSRREEDFNRTATR
jgi:hypothetical protein